MMTRTLRSARYEGRIRSTGRAWPSIAVTLAVSLVVSSARAEELPTAAIVSPSPSTEISEEVASAVEQLVRARVDQIDVARLSEAPALDISAIQLALGCVGETVECLGQIASELGVDVLVLPSLERAGTEYVLTLTVFDHRSGDLRRAVRRAAGEDAEREILDAVDSMVYEVFGLEAPPEAPDGQRLERLWIPLLTAGLGIVTLVVGSVFGSLASSAESDYAAAPTSTVEEVDAALALGEQAEDRALAANVLFGVGGAAVLAGAVLALVLFVRRGETPEQAIAFSPMVSADLAGAILTLRIGGGTP